MLASPLQAARRSGNPRFAGVTFGRQARAIHSRQMTKDRGDRDLRHPLHLTPGPYGRSVYFHPYGRMAGVHT